MNATDYRFFMKLKEGAVPINSTPKSIEQSAEFNSLINGKVIDRIKSGRGSCWTVVKTDVYEKFLKTWFPEDRTNPVTKSDNIKSFRNSKATRVATQPILFIRGFGTTTLAGKEFDIGHYTKAFGLFASKIPQLEHKQICFVENLDTFLHAEKLLGKDYLYIHAYGRLGSQLLSQIQAKHVLVFVDYDFNGLDEFLRIKKVFPDCTLYLPTDFNHLFNTYSRQMKGEQTQSQALQHCDDKQVIELRDLIAQTNRFLEQEFLIPS